MRAVWITRHGPPEVLEVREGPDPSPQAGQVRIRVASIGINFADLSARLGLYPGAPPPPCVVGYEVAGTVDALGSGVTGFTAGDRVVAMTKFGGYADCVCAPLAQVRRLPDAMDFDQAAALLVTYLTAHHMLYEAGRVRSGSKVLVHMAAGGVGLAAIELLKLVPDVVLFGTASASKHDFLREQGVQHPIDYNTQDYAAEVRRITDGAGVDLVLDPLGGTDWRKGYDLLAPVGRLVAFGFANAVPGSKRNMLRAVSQFLRMPRFRPYDMMRDNRTITGVHLGYLWEHIDLLAPQMDALLRYFEEGRIRPRVDKAFPLEEAPAAHQYIHDRKNKGKVVLTTTHHP